MQINPHVSQPVSTLKQTPVSLQSLLVVENKLTATVISASSQDQIRLQLSNQAIVTVASDLPVKAGDNVQLTRQSDGRIAIQVIAEPRATSSTATTVNLSVGQLIPVELIKQTHPETILVKPLTQQIVGLADSFEIDIRAIQAQWKAGDKWVLEVLNKQPLEVAIKTGLTPFIQAIQQAFLPLAPQTESTTLPQLNALLAKPETMPSLLREVLSQIVSNIADKSSMQQAESLQQQIRDSGLFLEQKLASPLSATDKSTLLQTDLKANLLQLMQVIKQVNQIPDASTLLTQTQKLATLPEPVQQALIKLLASPEALKTLPAHITSSLAATGQTPMQLIMSLLSGFTTSPSTTLPTNPSSNQPSNAAPQQTTVNSTASLNQTAVELQWMRDLLREVETLSSRIQYNQVSLLRDPDNPVQQPVWLFDLPVKDKQQLEWIQLRIEQQRRQQTEAEPIWQVQLNLETANLGLMQARLQLHQTNATVTWLAERADSVQLLMQHSESLNQRLRELGLNVQSIHYQQAEIVPLTAEPQREQSTQLLDITV